MTTGAYRKRRRERRGVILILVLGVLGLMAVIGVTFATFTGQARIAARSFAQSKIQPQSEEMMDFALGQLIMDTNDVRSAIRGHSLARDMYGNDGAGNGFVSSRSDGQQMAPANDSFFYITRVDPDPTLPNGYLLTTNISQGDTLFYGYSFVRWTVRIGYMASPPTGATGVINQSFEVVKEDGFSPGSSDPRRLGVIIPPTDIAASLKTIAGHNTITPASLIYANLSTDLGANFRFTLDGRWLNAFNGPGMTADALYGNFRFNTFSPRAKGMDEDYDACDLENWFLAMQSADGQVVIPSFHRPGIVRYDPAGLGGTVWNDWDNSASNPTILRQKVSRIIRPRQADGHDPATFPDLIPGADGKITYDVDNDGDGATDSVWVDLGYPARRNAQGKLFKPLFAFMVVGLNGRIPLNTAGNLAGRGIPNPMDPTLQESNATHAAHLGNSVSEIDPTYGLQNALNAAYTQYDSASMDVRLTQLRNILAGTRPHADPLNPAPTVNGDTNYVAMDNKPYYMPNGVYETGLDSNSLRLTNPVAGRWGEPESVPGGNYAPIAATYNNEVRPGYSISVRDLQAGPPYLPLDAADDNYNTFDVFPSVSTRVGEVGDSDWYDPAGALLLPVERIRRFLTPIDVNGSGSVRRWGGNGVGGDLWGRVEYRGYFRPPGLPAQLSASIPYPWTTVGAPYPSQRVTYENVVAAANSHDNNLLHGYESFRFPYVRGGPQASQRSGGAPAYRDLSNPPMDGSPPPLGVPVTVPTYDAKINASWTTSFTDETGAQQTTVGSRSDALNEADELNLYNTDPNLDAPFSHSDLEWLYRYHDVDGKSLTSRLSSLAPVSFTNILDGIRRRRLYSIDTWESNAFAWTNDNPQNAFAANSRFSANMDANASMSNLGAYTPALAQRGRKINLNMPFPASNDPNEPIRQKWISDAYQLLKTVLPPRAVDTPEELAQLGQYLVNVVDFRDPDCAMTRWRNPDVYYVPATGPTAGPTLASAGTIPLIQYGMEYNPIAINEVLAYSYPRKPATAAATTPTGPGVDTGRFYIELANTLTRPRSGSASNNASILNLSGFDSNLAHPGADAQNPYDGACWDLVFTMDDAQNRPDPFNGQLQPGATLYGLTPLGRNAVKSKTSGAAPVAGAADVLVAPLSGSQPATVNDLNDWFGDDGYLSVLTYEWPGEGPEQDSESTTGGQALPLTPPFSTPNRATLYALDRGFNPLMAGTAPTTTLPDGVLPLNADGSTPARTLPANKIVRDPTTGARYLWVYLRRPANPLAPVSAANPMIVVDSMRFPYIDSMSKAQTEAEDPPNSGKVDNVSQRGGNDIFSYQRLQPYRGGQAVPAINTTVGIDVRYGYTEQIAQPITSSGIQLKYGNATSQKDGSVGPVLTAGANAKLASGGVLYHTLGKVNDGATRDTAGPYKADEYWDFFPFHDRDFTSLFELTLVPGCAPGLFTKQFAEFAPSSANLPGFRKAATATRLASMTSFTMMATTDQPKGDDGNNNIANDQVARPFLWRANGNYNNPVEPHTYPYLVDKFFYTAAGISDVPAVDALNTTVGGFASDGWFKMFEFFEVPSQSNGAIGTVAQGTNFDWARQDVRPGLMNLNLIIDEEAFLAVLGKQDMDGANKQLDAVTYPSFKQELMNPYVIAAPQDVGLGAGFDGGAWPGPLGGPGAPTFAGHPTIPMVVTATLSNGAPAYAYPMPNVGVTEYDSAMTAPLPVLKNQMKAAFAQFLWARHGGSGFVFGYGEGATGENAAILLPTMPSTLGRIPAERPFRSPSFPDIDYTALRPAILPPSTMTDPVASTLGWTDPANPPTTFDPGLRNNMRFGGVNRTVIPVSPYTSGATTVHMLPPPIPARRFFQLPDAYNGSGGGTRSNAGLRGDPFVNDLAPVGGNPIIGGLPVQLQQTAVGTYAPLDLNDGAPNLFIPNANTPPTYNNADLGRGGGATPNLAQHPCFRSELMQRVMNLTTVRTHQFAVWITVGFFEVKREGDIAMIGDPTYPQAAFDVLGPEIGAATAQNIRYRSFFVVDRLKLTGFDPDSVGGYRPAVVYRRTIE